MTEKSPNESGGRLLDSEFGQSFLGKYREAVTEVHKEIIDLDDVIEQVLLAAIAGGHAILEGIPGVGKTLLAITVARVIDAKLKRIQLNPGTLPEEMYYAIESFDTGAEGDAGKKVSEARWGPGPLFTQILLSDEINRAMPRSLAPMLEAMQEHQITIEGKTHYLGEFFFHMATQNPVETSESTNELPAALRERFMLMVHVPYPSPELIRKVAVRDTNEKMISAILSTKDIVEVRARIYDEYVRDKADTPSVHYIQRLISFIEQHPLTLLAPGIRAGEDLAMAAAVHAFLHERPHITFEDVQREAHPVFRFKFKRHYSRSRHLGIRSNDAIISDALSRVPLVELSP